MTPVTPPSRATTPPDLLSPFLAVARRVDGMASWTVGHSRRVSRIAVAIAVAVRWTPSDTARLARAAELHDVGKLCVAEEILGRPGPLDAAARAEVEMHPALGANMLSTILGADEASWVRHHHEWWDGGGYPRRLREDQIPAGACIVGLAEAWDAMRSPGPVRPHNMSTHEALACCRAAAGVQFAPWAVDAIEGIVHTLGEVSSDEFPRS